MTGEYPLMLTFNLSEALNNILSAKMRSFLALLGILVGTASVVAMVSCGTLATDAALAQFKTLGTGLMSVAINPKSIKQQIYLALFTRQRANNLINASPMISHVAPYTSSYLPVEYGGKSINAAIIGVTQSLATVISIKTQRGRFISDLDNYNHYCYLGQAIYQQLAKVAGADVIGHQIRLGASIFTIVGVAKNGQKIVSFIKILTMPYWFPLMHQRH